MHQNWKKVSTIAIHFLALMKRSLRIKIIPRTIIHGESNYQMQNIVNGGQSIRPFEALLKL